MVVGTGIDVVRIDRLRAALLRHPQRLPRRLFGPSEIEGGGQVERLAQRLSVTLVERDELLTAIPHVE